MSDQAAFRFTPVEEFAAVDEPGAAALARASAGGVVIAADGIVIVYGDGGAGKTTLVADVSFALAAGRSWLGIVEADRPLRIALVENEGPRQEFRDKLERKLAATGDKLDGRIAVLEDPWGELTLASDEHRQGLAAAIAAHEADLLVLGPLVSAGEFPNGGTPDEIKRFEQHLRHLRQLVGRSFAVLLVHHENAQGRLSGAWGRLPDTLLHVTAQGHGRTRIFWQKARWASALHGTSTNLLWADGETYTIEAKPEITADTMRDDLLTAVLEHGGLSWSKIRELHADGDKLVRGNATELAGVRDRLIREGLLINVAPREGAFTLWHRNDPACPRSDAGTGLERLPFPSPTQASEADPFPVLRSIENGRNGNGTDEPAPPDHHEHGDHRDHRAEELEWR